MIGDFNSEFMQRINDTFAEMDDAIVSALPDKDEHYSELLAQEQRIKDQFPDIDIWLEGDGALSLTAEERAGMVEYLELNAEKEDIERLAIYYRGHKDCISYLKTISAL